MKLVLRAAAQPTVLESEGGVLGSGSRGGMRCAHLPLAIVGRPAGTFQSDFLKELKSGNKPGN